MFHLSSKHHFDITFVILCVVAGAISHSITNTSKIPINQPINHYGASFIDFILDASLLELLQSSNTINNKNSAIQYPTDHKTSAAKAYQQSRTVCSQFSHILSGNQFKFCHRHQDVLEIVLPQIIQLTKEECTRLTSDLRWRCTAIEFYLDRSNPLAFTKEAALIRSILNASMVYLVVKTCSAASHRSCGCQNNQRYSTVTNILSRETRGTFQMQKDYDNQETSEAPMLSIDHQNLSQSDLLKLDAGSPLRLTNSIDRHHGCLANIAFAYAFTKVFIDSDDIKSLNKAYRILNEEQNYNGIINKRHNFKKLIDSDHKDLAYIKWTKSAINLHNNHLGRQMVRKAIQRRCRCHGLSGACQFQTCWDQLLDFDIIRSRLKSVYFTESIKVESRNSGTPDKPDLSLARSNRTSTTPSNPRFTSDTSTLTSDVGAFLASSSSIFTNDQPSAGDRVGSGQLLYLYDSPEYCEPLPKIRHFGTRGRVCALSNNSIVTLETSKKSIRNAEVEGATDKIDTRQGSAHDAPGSCEQLCCNRGYHSELVFDMVTCNCRFKFCCRIECDHCLEQRLQHYCL